PVAEVLLCELAHATVAWAPNFDGTLEEPSWLPARLPHLMPNGTTAIAMGIATDLPPHHLHEVVSACVRLLPAPAATVSALRSRATHTREGTNIIVTALPYQVSPSKVIEQIAAQMRARKLPWLEDIRDESDHANPVRIALVPRSNRVDVEQLMGHLFATTDL